MKIFRILFSLFILLVTCSCLSDHKPDDDLGRPARLAKIKFEDITEQVGLANLGAKQASWADLDNDGWVDLVSKGQIWKNINGQKFINVSGNSGIPAGYGSCVIADFNGDGINDIYFIHRGGNLYHGKGDCTFTQGISFKNKVSVQAASAVDFNNDGYVDIYRANYEIWKKQLGFRDVILRNDNGSLVKQWEASDEKLMRGRGATSCDFNNDGLMDIYVSNYRLMPNFLWINKGNWQMADLAREYGCAGGERKKTVFKNSIGVRYGSSGHTIGSLWADFDNDTYFDLFVGNFSHPPLFQDRPQFLKNGGPSKNYHFIDKSAIARIPWQESYASPAAADVDNDGLVDLFFGTVYPRDTGRLFHNLGGWVFRDITSQSTIKSSRSYQNAFADFDNDGRIDLINSGRLYRNVSDSTGNWLEILLQGREPNSSAIGAQVILFCGDKKYIRQVEAGTGAGNQNDLRLHFGIGNYAKQVKIKITWPNRKVDYHNAKPNIIITLKQQN
jgi:enediyne biosynthesis protein E4